MKKNIKIYYDCPKCEHNVARVGVGAHHNKLTCDRCMKYIKFISETELAGCKRFHNLTKGPPWDESRIEGIAAAHEENYGIASIDSRTAVVFTEESEKLVKAEIEMQKLHAKALACHCECLGMNAENMWAAIANADPVYKSKDYYKIMHKWGLANEKGEPII
jgi:hypothetical protein